MTPDRFATLIDAYGASPERWPAPERQGALGEGRGALDLAAQLHLARVYPGEAEQRLHERP